MWWNLFGLLITVLTSLVVSLLTPSRPPQEVRPYTLAGSGFFRNQRLWRPGYSLLLLYFLALLLFLSAMDYFAVAVLPVMQG